MSEKEKVDSFEFEEGAEKSKDQHLNLIDTSEKPNPQASAFVQSRSENKETGLGEDMESILIDKDELNATLLSRS
jgi:hypothetical protein